VKIYDFLCPDGHLEERVVRTSEERTIECSCGKIAQRQLSAPPCILDGASGDFPGRALKWERDHEKAGRGSHYNEE